MGELDWRANREGNLGRGREITPIPLQDDVHPESEPPRNETGRNVSRPVCFFLDFKKDSESVSELTSARTPVSKTWNLQPRHCS